MQNLTQTISKNLAKLRLQNRLSLDKLSERSGVSKAMLSQIERGESNPTVNTLWKIATGLRVSFNDLLQEDSQEIELVRHASCPLINDTANGLSLFSLFPFKSDKPFEVFTAKLQPQCTHFASPHAVGSEEYVLLSKGALYIHVNNTDYKLQGGDALRFPADQPHHYHNPGLQELSFHCMLYHACS